MSLPKTGPYSSIITSGSPFRIYQRDRTWYRQAKPYNLPLPFEFVERRVLHSDRPEWDSLNSSGGPDNCRSITWDYLRTGWAIDKAAKRFKGKVGEFASWAVSLAERKQAISMMTQRLIQLGKAFRAINRFDFVGAGKHLLFKEDADKWELLRKKQREGKLKRSSRYAADNYLEFHFGWSPLMSDIYSTIDILQRDVPPLKARGSGSISGVDEYPRQGYSPANATVRWWCKAKLGADITVSNPNLWQANQLGLVNPALVAFETVPFSFVADWFVNVSEFLGSFTEYYGLTLSNTFHTVSYQEDRTWRWPELNESGQSTALSVRRLQGLPVMTLHTRKPWNLSVRRGAAAASLLVQLLPRR